MKSAGKEPKVFAETPVLLKQLANAEIDAALIFELPGNAEINNVLRGGRLRLRGLPEEFETQATFVLPVRIPGGTYHGQAEFVEADWFSCF